MYSIYTLDKVNQTGLLEGLALLSRIYWGPAAEDCRDLMQGTYLKPFEALKPIVAYEPPAIIDELTAVTTSFADEDKLFLYLEQSYVRLFINSRGGIAAPLYASCYAAGGAPGEDAPLMGPPAVLMKESFQSKGLSLGDHIGEPPDHLSIELEYLFFLLQKGWVDDDSDLIDEAVSFAAEIMLPWVIKFQQRLTAVDARYHFYQLTAAILCAVLGFIGSSDKESGRIPQTP
jgi:putative dimethyl sulfoxide reductase chaperone